MRLKCQTVLLADAGSNCLHITHKTCKGCQDGEERALHLCLAQVWLWYGREQLVEGSHCIPQLCICTVLNRLLVADGLEELKIVILQAAKGSSYKLSCILL